MALAAATELNVKQFLETRGLAHTHSLLKRVRYNISLEATEEAERQREVDTC